MSENRLKSFTKQGLEAIIAILMVLAFYSVFLVLLNGFFPSGAGMTGFEGGQGFRATASLLQQSVRNLFLSSGERDVPLTDTVDLAAVLSLKRNDVKNRRAQSIAWTPARQGMGIYDRDAVQTFKRASATITFDPKNYLVLGQNSLVIIQRLEQDLFRSEKRSFLVMVDGELRGKIGQIGENAVHLQVSTPSAVAKIRSRQSEDGEAEFRISINEDESSTISVFHGVAEVTAEGKTVRIEANQSSLVNLNQAPEAPVSLLGPPAILSPAQEEVLQYRDLPPMILFTWSAVKGAEKYNIVLARDSRFRDIFYQEKTSSPSFAHGNLKKGVYYWKVSSVKGKHEGAFGELRRFEVFQDLKPPELTVDFPPERVHQEAFVLTGETEPLTRVFVGGEPVSITASGRFEYPLVLKEGANVIVVEAVDEAGNVTYLSRLVYGKF